MASYALLPIFNGFTFDLPSRKIGFSPIVEGDFRCFFSVGGAWGEYERRGSLQTVRILFGSLTLVEPGISGSEAVKTLIADGTPTDFTQNGSTLKFNTVTALSSIEVVR